MSGVDETFGLTRDALAYGDAPARRAIEHVLARIHEAGHAVTAARVLNWQVTECECGLVSDIDTHHGQTSAFGETGPDTATGRALFALAGQAAEYHWLTDREMVQRLGLDSGLPDGRLETGAFSELDTRTLLDAFPHTAFKTHQEAFDEVRDFIARNWQLVLMQVRNVQVSCDCLTALNTAPRQWVDPADRVEPFTAPRPSTASVPPAVERAPAAVEPRPASGTTTTNSGGTSMAGIEEILAAISNTSSKSEQIQGALAQVQQWAGEIAGHLHMALGESGQHEVQQVIGAFQELAGQRIDELHQLVSGAVTEIEQYGQRL